MILWQRTPAATGALMKRDCFPLRCSWLLFKIQHCVRPAPLETRRGFIKIQLMACMSAKELLLSLIHALQHPRCDSYCRGIIRVKRSKVSYGQRFLLVHFCRAALWKC